ncbi:2-oxo-4-hydroxy-4-carboxy-5-ureidoimidazoline decarboxylase [Peribacillus sp. NPDC097295]|uniref:2-oxo-4-hydroxy-4-carboxy-5-ureidoimidazoline decarboxylase n=1 Tax=Peribacillus sp. NPDC097295 TaxID=3364402 RepID=UPI0037F63911
MISLEMLQVKSDEEFTDFLGDVFEHSPWIPEQAAASRPFSTLLSLHQCMVDIVNRSSTEKKLDLIRKHPNLGDKVEMTDDSIKEQRGAGLKDLTALEYENFLSLNKRYMDKFGFPFILAVRGKDKNEIYDAMQTRIHHTEKEEFETALFEIHRIALLRLQEKIKN